MRLVEAIKLACQADPQQRAIEWYVRIGARQMRWFQISSFGRGYWERFDGTKFPGQLTRGNQSANRLEELIGKADGGVFRLVPPSGAKHPLLQQETKELTADELLQWIESNAPGLLQKVNLPNKFAELLV